MDKTQIDGQVMVNILMQRVNDLTADGLVKDAMIQQLQNQLNQGKDEVSYEHSEESIS